MTNDISDANSETGLVHSIDLNSAKEATLAVLVHGKAGNYQVVSIFKDAFKDCNIICPQAFLDDPIGGYSWWIEPTEDQFNLAADKLFNFVNSAISFYDLEPKKIIALGFSQGGACLSWLSQQKPDLFSSLALLASFYLQKSDVDISSYPNFFFAHGSNDPDVGIDKAHQAVEFLSNKGAKVVFISEPVGHKIGPNALKHLKLWATSQI